MNGYAGFEENKPDCDGGKFSMPFSKKDHPIDYAQGCASIRKTVAVTAQASDEGAASDEVAELF